jgi:ferrous iron transport protein B
LLAKKLGVPVVSISARKLEGINELKTAISFANKFALQEDSIDVTSYCPRTDRKYLQRDNTDNPYFALQLAHQHETLKFLTPAQSDRIEELEKEHSFHSQKAQATETIARYNYINDVLYDTVKTPVTAHDESTAIK